MVIHNFLQIYLFFLHVFLYLCIYDLNELPVSLAQCNDHEQHYTRNDKDVALKPEVDHRSANRRCYQPDEQIDINAEQNSDINDNENLE